MNARNIESSWPTVILGFLPINWRSGPNTARLISLILDRCDPDPNAAGPGLFVARFSRRENA